MCIIGLAARKNQKYRSAHPLQTVDTTPSVEALVRAIRSATACRQRRWRATRRQPGWRHAGTQAEARSVTSSFKALGIRSQMTLRHGADRFARATAKKLLEFGVTGSGFLQPSDHPLAGSAGSRGDRDTSYALIDRRHEETGTKIPRELVPVGFYLRFVASLSGRAAIADGSPAANFFKPETE